MAVPVLIMKFSVLLASLDLGDRALLRFHARAPRCSCTNDAVHRFLSVSGTYYLFDPQTNSSLFEKSEITGPLGAERRGHHVVCTRPTLAYILLTEVYLNRFVVGVTV